LDIALYHPYMDAPQSAWLTQVLLYWDGVATIVPRAHNHPRSAYTRQLEEASLVRRVFPEEALRGVDFNSFSSTFLSFVEAGFTFGPPSFTEIHAGKMPHRLFSELRKMGFARTRVGAARAGWYEVETGTANAFMAFLAGVICGKSSTMTPVTDSELHMAALISGDRSQKEKLNSLRYAAIFGSLPTPSGPVDPQELVRFKQRYGEELKQCREYLDLQLIELARADSDGYMFEYELSLKLNQLRAEMKEVQRELQAKMYERKWPGIVRASFGGVTAAGLGAATSVAAGGSALVLGLALATTAATLVDPARTIYGKLRQSPSDSRSPLIYAALTGNILSSNSGPSKRFEE
jgi:hypothetical protein